MSTSSTRTNRPVVPAPRPLWAVNWSRAQRGLPPVSSQPTIPPPTVPSPPPSLTSTDFAISPPPRRSRRLSDHLTREEQDTQALANDRVQRQALPSNRQLPTLRIDTTSPVSPSRGWKDTRIQDRSRVEHQRVERAVDLDLEGPVRFEPSKVHEELLKKESIRPPPYGGRSKNQQLGSVTESWGIDPSLDVPKGMFELEDDPPSPILDRQLTAAEIRAERARRAILGIPAEKSGRPSIKEMEKAMINKMKEQELQAERRKSNIDMSQLGAALDVGERTSTRFDRTESVSRFSDNTAPPGRYPPSRPGPRHPTRPMEDVDERW